MKKLTNLTILLFILSLNIFLEFAVAEGDATKGKANYDKLCVSCHGEKGAGDGPVGIALPEGMKPRNLQNGAFKFTSDLEKFTKLIKEGGAAVGLNPFMPPQTVITEASDFADLYAYVLSLKVEK